MPYKDKSKQLAYQNEWMQKRRREWIASQGGCCKLCGSTKQLEVDHIDPETKLDHKVWSWAKERREAELAKCQVLCWDCHIEKTLTENEYGYFTHGTQNGYKRGKCRCSACWLAYNNRRNELRALRRQAAQVLQPMVFAAEQVTHVNAG